MTARIPPGWSASGKQIIDPIQFLESILKPIIHNRKQKDTRTPTYTEVEDFTDNTGKIVTHKHDYHYGLIIDFPESLYQTQMIPSLGLTRIAANGDGNCWFDSFLFCMSPSYRMLSARNRISVTREFRSWCADHGTEIFKSLPHKIKDAPEFSDLTETLLQSDISTPNKELDLLEGLFIAWFFGVNCIYFATPGKYPNKPMSPFYEPICESMIQSPNCKVICMVFSGNHFEPLIHASFSGELLDESSKTFFSWKDPLLCTCIQYVISSDCSQADFGVMAVQPWKITCTATGGRRRSRTQTRRVKRRRFTRKRRA